MNILQWLLPFGFLGMMLVKEDEGAVVTEDDTSKDTDEKTEGEAETGEVEKTQKPSDEDEEKNLLESGESIPFPRFKQFIEKRNLKTTDFEGQIGTLSTELEDIRESLNNPAVQRALLQSQGITDQKILNQKLTEKGFKVEEEVKEDELFTKLTQGLDLAKQGDWVKLVMRAVDFGAKKQIAPLEGKIASRETIDMLNAQEPEARKISKLFNVEYGVEAEDAKNIKTGVGILAQFLTNNPEKKRLVAGGQLSKGEALVLAFKDSGFQMGKQAGKTEEQTRNQDLKDSAMEDDTVVAKGKLPSPDASITEIMDFARKNEI